VLRPQVALDCMGFLLCLLLICLFNFAANVQMLSRLLLLHLLLLSLTPLCSIPPLSHAFMF